jgi:hypothetical protein
MEFGIPLPFNCQKKTDIQNFTLAIPFYKSFKIKLDTTAKFKENFVLCISPFAVQFQCDLTDRAMKVE